MNDVSANDAVKEVAINPTKVTINGGESTLDKGPAVAAVMVDRGVVVVQIGDGNYTNLG